MNYALEMRLSAIICIPSFENWFWVSIGNKGIHIRTYGHTCRHSDSLFISLPSLFQIRKVR
jgi:hypothetical protein